MTERLSLSPVVTMALCWCLCIWSCSHVTSAILYSLFFFLVAKDLLFFGSFIWWDCLWGLSWRGLEPSHVAAVGLMTGLWLVGLVLGSWMSVVYDRSLGKWECPWDYGHQGLSWVIGHFLVHSWVFRWQACYQGKYGFISCWVPGQNSTQVG